jgi:hypothetical protein
MRPRKPVLTPLLPQTRASPLSRILRAARSPSSSFAPSFAPAGPQATRRLQCRAGHFHPRRLSPFAPPGGRPLRRADSNTGNPALSIRAAISRATELATRAVPISRFHLLLCGAPPCRASTRMAGGVGIGARLACPRAPSSRLAAPASRWLGRWPDCAINLM